MCDRVAFPGGGVAIICGARHRRRPPCVHCGATSEFACDGPTTSEKRVTCDRPLCRRCRIHVPPDQDFCKDHRGAAKLAAAQLRLFDGAASFERVK
jgi:hypothetical protein